MKALVLAALVLACASALACSGEPDADSATTFPNAGDAQTPPTTGDADAMLAWLARGSYKSWHCEAQAHEPRGPSMHGMNRTCSNDSISTFAGKGADERPAGSAAVKEFWDGGQVIGHAAYIKTADQSAGGDNWFWFVELGGMAKANGSPTRDMVAKAACVACHSPAGSDADHLLSPHSGDFVYTQVEP